MLSVLPGFFVVAMPISLKALAGFNAVEFTQIVQPNGTALIFIVSAYIRIKTKG